MVTRVFFAAVDDISEEKSDIHDCGLRKNENRVLQRCVSR